MRQIKIKLCRKIFRYLPLFRKDRRQTGSTLKQFLCYLQETWKNSKESLQPN